MIGVRDSAIPVENPVVDLDRLVVESRVARFGTTSFAFAQEIRFPDGREAARAEVTMVSVDDDGRPVPVPEALRERLGS